MLTSLGIASIGIDSFFLPGVAFLLLVGLLGFWRSGQISGRKWPFWIAVISSGAVLVGRLIESPTCLWIGTFFLAVAYVSDQLMKRGVRRAD
ncbi:MAG: hypothetical protein DA330_05815 [Nitrososphaera sp.]|nr:hypothetical protein [Nitrososphaera sp.]